MKVIVIGGGFAGCAAALQAKKMGADVTIYERTDLLLGVGNVGGIMRNNGRYTAAEELISMGAGEIIKIMDSLALHKNMEFSGHKHAWLTDIGKAEPFVRRLLLEKGIKINFKSRVVDVKLSENKIDEIILSDKTSASADVFIEATGSTGGMDNCYKYGNGCAMCVLRCPSFGPRVSISQKAGIQDILGERGDGKKGAMSGSCEIPRESISEELLAILDRDGVVTLKVPEEDVHLEKLSQKVCQQYALKEFAENVILLDTGHIKLMTSHYNIGDLRKIRGLENARYIDPLSGSNGNSIRYLGAAPRNNAMKVIGIDNLYCAGEKSGFFVGHTEAISTGTLAGYNSIKCLKGEEELILPRECAVGDIIAYANERLNTEGGMGVRHTFSGAEYFERMKALGLYTTLDSEVKSRIENLGLAGIFLS
ncbi:MAG: FAD-dependent oxidoreductase [Clostridium sp.]